MEIAVAVDRVEGIKGWRNGQRMKDGSGKKGQTFSDVNVKCAPQSCDISISLTECKR